MYYGWDFCSLYSVAGFMRLKVTMCKISHNMCLNKNAISDQMGMQQSCISVSSTRKHSTQQQHIFLLLDNKDSSSNSDLLIYIDS